MNTDINAIKKRFGIIGRSPALDRAIDIAVQVAATDLSVLVTGESGVGKENFPRIIHEYSVRRHGEYIAVNCGAIPEGTIDSELFGHEKGAFTGAVETRKGYFEVADGGTIFLDEVADLPPATQTRLLRVLENGEFIRVGSSKVLHTDTRVVAATNVNIAESIANGKFREDLYYRLNTVPIHIPALRERKDDICPLFMKFAADFSAKYHFPPVTLTDDAMDALTKYSWPGNIRQLKNVTEQISLIEKKREVDGKTLSPYLTSPIGTNLPTLLHKADNSSDSFHREMLFKFIGELKREVDSLKAIVGRLVDGGMPKDLHLSANGDEYQITQSEQAKTSRPAEARYDNLIIIEDRNEEREKAAGTEKAEEKDLSIENAEKMTIIEALQRNGQSRKLAARDLRISERTLYRKIKEYGL